MAVAGKVAITLSTENGGAWSADVTYDRLVAVKHNNNLYISRKTVANVEPPNDEFWFLALEGFGGEDVEALIDRLNELSDLIQAIIDGTAQVGNAKTLDGHGAEYFAPLADLANYLPKTGGTVTAQHFLPLGLKNANGNNSYIQFEGKDGVLGYLGFESTNVLRLLSSVGGSLGDILHTGNKPTGTYTGNGDATARTINIGGIGKVCVIQEADAAHNVAIVTEHGAFVRNSSTVNGLARPAISYSEGVLVIQTNDDSVNHSGWTYTYQVL